MPTMNFGEALAAMKEGKCVTRKGWKDNWTSVHINKGSTCALPERETAIDGISDHLFELGDEDTLTRHPNITLRTKSYLVPGWIPTQTDLLAEDWTILS